MTSIISTGLRSALVFAGMMAFSSVSHASIVFSNFGNPGFSYDTQNGTLLGNDFSGDNLAQGNHFSPISNVKLTSVTLALSCVFSCPDNLIVALRSDSVNSPGAVLESFTVAGTSLGALGNNNPVIVLNSVLQPLLTAGLGYWITVTTTLNNVATWNNNLVLDPAVEAESSDAGFTWFVPSGNTPGAYRIDGVVPNSVPEPSSLALLLGGTGLFGLVRKRISAVR